MRVRKDFSPVNITLDTEEEVDLFVMFLGAISEEMLANAIRNEEIGLDEDIIDGELETKVEADIAACNLLLSKLYSKLLDLEE